MKLCKHLNKYGVLRSLGLLNVFMFKQNIDLYKLF